MREPDKSPEKGATIVEYAIGAAAIVLPLILIVNALQGGVTNQIDDSGSRVGTPTEISNGVSTP
ncbi:MAG: Flp family type IVb pilin [Acidimicrobiales bacterium]